MRIDPEDLRRHYAEISDEELLDLDRADLLEMAQQIYDGEIARRGLNRPRQPETPPAPADAAPAPADFEDCDLDGPPPAWLESAVCAYSWYVRRSEDLPSGSGDAGTVLWAARIPSYLVVKQEEAETDPILTQPYNVCSVMVPGELGPHAHQALELGFFNPQAEAEWRTRLEAMSDHELFALKPEEFCAALLDKAERLKHAYYDEIARRKR